MKQLNLSLVIILMAFSNFAYSQQKVFNVWPGNIPGAIKNSAYVEVTDSNDNWIKTRKISNPTLDFYPVNNGKNNNTAVIICPGGGYRGVAIEHEGYKVAEWLNSIGVSAFVLKYRLPDASIMKNKTIAPMQDGQEAIRMVRRHAKEWNIDPKKIGVLGFSAGGHLAATLSTRFNEKVYETTDTTSARPDFSILIYPVITMDSSITNMGTRINLLGENPTLELVKKFSNELQVTTQTPPAFLIHSIDDGTVPFQNSVNYVFALKKYSIPCELHLYPTGGHGYGLGRSKNTESSWPEACKLWLLSF
jgi:acetyl esterase/lipase